MYQRARERTSEGARRAAVALAMVPVREWLNANVGVTREQFEVVEPRRRHVEEILDAAERAGELGPFAPAADRLATHPQFHGERPAARPWFERALAASEATSGPDHPWTSIYRSDLALLLEQMGDAAGARPLLERAIATDDASPAPDPVSLSNKQGNLGSELLTLGDAAAARPVADRALALAEQTQGPDHPDVALRLSILASALEALGQVAEARAMMRRAVAIGERRLGPDNPHLVIYRRRLAELGGGD